MSSDETEIDMCAFFGIKNVVKPFGLRLEKLEKEEIAQFVIVRRKGDPLMFVSSTRDQFSWSAKKYA